jgi:hypothetical protein
MMCTGRSEYFSARPRPSSRPPRRAGVNLVCQLPAVTTFSHGLSGIRAFSRPRGWSTDTVMPIGRYIAWVGASLLVLLLVVNWLLPPSLMELTADEASRPVIRIASLQQPPERVVIDTRLPTIVPPPAPFAEIIPAPPLPVPSVAPPAPRPAVVNVEKQKPKAIKRQVNDVAAKQVPPSRPTAVVNAAPATAPPTRLSFANVLSGQFVRDIFNLR